MNSKYAMTISMNVLNHLGINLYSNIPAVLSEIVANSWDADATNVKIDISTEKKSITIIDDGIGMTVDDINNHYLYVGYEKRSAQEPESTIYKRKYMGRKGIGKLSMFSIAKTIDVITRKDGVLSAFRMDVDDITKVIQDSEGLYYPMEISCETDTDIEEHGTKIILTNLKKNISTATPEFLKHRIARRFSIIGDKYHFSVSVNGEPITVDDRDYYSFLEYVWYYGAKGEDDAAQAVNAEAKYQRENLVKDTETGKIYTISGWIGTVKSAGSLKDGEDNINKIVVLVRGKVGQEDILADFSEGGLYSKYLIGEIHADFFDEDDQEDMATSSRQEYRHDDSRYIALRNFVYGELKHIQSQWTDCRLETGLKSATTMNPLIGEWYESLPRDEKTAAKTLLGKVNQMTVSEEKRNEILQYCILAFEKLRYSHQLSRLDNLDADNLKVLGAVISGFDDLEATLYYQIVKDRVEIIKYFNSLVEDNEKEKAIQKYLFDHLWLLDPSWERAQESAYMEKTVFNALGLTSERLTQDERIGRLDLGYREVTGKHVIIELKRAERVVSLAELLDQVAKYKSAMEKVLQDAGMEPVFEIIVVLGKPVDNDASSEHRKYISDTLLPSKCRVVYYTELINNAFRSYSAYLEKSKETERLVGVLDQIALETIR